MTWFIVKWFVIGFTLWFLNGLRKVWKNPRFKIISEDDYDSGIGIGKIESKAQRVEVYRQQYIPPFNNVKETYVKILTNRYERDLWARLGDGHKPNEEIQNLIDQQLNLYIQEQKYVEHLGKTSS